MASTDEHNAITTGDVAHHASGDDVQHSRSASPMAASTGHDAEATYASTSDTASTHGADARHSMAAEGLLDSHQPDPRSPDEIRTLDELARYAAADDRFAQAAARIGVESLGRSAQVVVVMAFAGERLIATAPHGETTNAQHDALVRHARALADRARRRNAVVEVDVQQSTDASPGTGSGPINGARLGDALLLAAPLDDTTPNRSADEASDGRARDPQSTSRHTDGLVIAALVRNVGVGVLPQLRQRLLMLRQARSRALAEIERRALSAHLQRSRAAVGVVAACNRQTRLYAAAAALVNELADVLGADRVSFGAVNADGAKLLAMSHVEKFSRKQELVGDIEASMEEAADQDADVVAPDVPELPPTVDFATGRLSHSEHAAVLSSPLRRGDEVVGALTIERSAHHPFTLGDVALVRLVAELVGPRLQELRDTDRWVGAKLITECKRVGAAIVGPRHTLPKMLALAFTALLIAATVIDVPRQAGGSFTLVAETRRVIAAPFDGFVNDVLVDVDERVAEGQPLFTMRTTELELELASLRRQGTAARARAARARGEGDAAAAEIAAAEADQFEVQAALIEARLDAAMVRAPIDGVVVTPRPSQFEGRSTKRGEPVLDVAQADRLYAEVFVPEEQADIVAVGARVSLAPLSDPDRIVRGKVRRVATMTTVREGRNVAPIEVGLESSSERVRMGMSGAARIDAGEASAIAVYTKPLRDWITLQWFRLF
jgi:hypothetical protein